MKEELISFETAKIAKEKVVEHYYSNKSIEGLITEIGDKVLDPKSLHIYLSGYNDFKIFLDIDQHNQLEQYYKKQRVRLKVRLKKSMTSQKILSARLLNYKVKSKLDFPFNLQEIDA